jgi:hypothetical protein
VWLFFGAAPAGYGSLSRTTVWVLFIRADFISLSSLSHRAVWGQRSFFSWLHRLGASYREGVGTGQSGTEEGLSTIAMNLLIMDIQLYENSIC